jgi:branched-chain amino acid transport system permease protein
MSGYVVSVLSNIGVLSFLALSAYLVLVAGEISFGQQAFFGVAAYAGGIATALWGWPLWAALIWGATLAGLAATAIAWPTMRLRGLYFAIATLAFAELVRLALELFRYQRRVGAELVGPLGSDGFREIRWVFESNVTPLQFMALVWTLLALAVALLFLLERTRAGACLRAVGRDPELAHLLGLRVHAMRVAAAAAAGALAGIGGVLYAHMTTYLEPQLFNVMLGVHGLAYGLIGGLGTAFGPILGVLVDIGLIEASRLFSGYRMIVFGGLVAALLIWRPRGLLDEATVHRLGAWLGRQVARGRRTRADKRAASQ